MSDPIEDYYREYEVPPRAYDNHRLPCYESMKFHMSMMNPTHQVMRSLENNLDSVFEKHHGGGGYDFDEDEY